MVAVDPYIQPDRQKEVFDRDLRKLGVLPFYLLVENGSARELSLDRVSIVLELPDGRQIGRVNAATAAPRLDVAMPGSFLPGGNFGSFLVGVLLIPVELIVADAQIRGHEARKAKYMNTELQDVVLSKDASTHGFVYFLPPSGTLWYTKARVALRFVDKTDGTSFVIRVPVNESGLFSDKQGEKVQH
ncbi:MAG TPA: hypothetical protein VNL14_22105 [Candidatus Acidoferrales bacterium]|nr:hypothetical protein [Candidatus Acidoferrales bacterium]